MHRASRYSSISTSRTLLWARERKPLGMLAVWPYRSTLCWPHSPRGPVPSQRTGTPSRSRTAVLDTGGAMKKSARQVSHANGPGDALGEPQLRERAWSSAGPG